MARYKEYDYKQAKLLPVFFHKQIQPGTFEFTLSYLIDNKIDMSIFEDFYCNDETGAPAYDPAVLLKIILLGYSRGIISSRDIEKACKENIIFMALSADQRPHFTTIAGFISRMKSHVLKVFTDVLLYCDEIGLIGKNMFAIDGCKLPSNASKEWSGTRESFKRKKEKMQKAIEYIVDKHNTADNKDDNCSAMDERERKYIKTLQKHIEKIENFIKAHDDKIGKSGNPINSNVTDNESATMKTSHGVVQGYNGVAAVDDKHQIIVHAETFGQAHENDLLKPMIKGVKNNFKSIGVKGNVCKQAQLTADAGFHSEENMKMLFKESIDAYIADTQFRKRDPKFADVDKYKERSRKEKRKASGRYKTYTTSDFKFAEDLSFCICPSGQRLYRDGGNTYTKGRHAVRFKGPKSACGPCKLRSECLRKPDVSKVRSVAYFTGETKGDESKYTKKMINKIDSDQGRAIYSKRIGTVEPVFANIRHALKLDRFTVRSKAKVNIQWNLYAIIHNILKIHRLNPILNTG